MKQYQIDITKSFAIFGRLKWWRGHKEGLGEH